MNTTEVTDDMLTVKTVTKDLDFKTKTLDRFQKCWFETIFS